MQFDHIGIAVESIENYFKTILEPVFHCKMTSGVFIDNLQKSKVAFAETTDGTRIELIEPLGVDSPVFEILKIKRGGLHHMCFASNNFDEAIQKCKNNKLVMVSSPKPAIAFNNLRVAFFLTPSGEVIELLEQLK